MGHVTPLTTIPPLLISLAEQLKLPLQQIARRAELAALGEPVDTSDFGVIANAGLTLMDSFLLSLQLGNDAEIEAATEPLTISSVLYDTAHDLSGLAKFYGVELELNVEGRYEPVRAHRQGLQAALTSLGFSLIEAMPAADNRKLTLQLAAHRCRYGIVAGLYSDTQTISLSALRRGRTLLGNRQPAVDLSPSASAGLFVADALMQAMQLPLRATRHHHLQGWGATLPPNPQLQLV